MCFLDLPRTKILQSTATVVQRTCSRFSIRFFLDREEKLRQVSYPVRIHTYLCTSIIMATIKDGKGIKALAVTEHGGALKPIEIGRPEPGPEDVRIKVLYCGMCHSDVHAVRVVFVECFRF